MNGDFVLDPNAPHAFHIDSRFQGYDVACTNFLFLVSPKPRPLVDFDAQTVSCTMHEVRSQPMLMENTPRGPVNASGTYTSPESVMRGFLGLFHRFVPSLDASGCASQKDHAR